MKYSRILIVMVMLLGLQGAYALDLNLILSGKPKEKELIAWFREDAPSYVENIKIVSADFVSGKEKGTVRGKVCFIMDLKENLYVHDEQTQQREEAALRALLPKDTSFSELKKYGITVPKFFTLNNSKGSAIEMFNKIAAEKQDKKWRFSLLSIELEPAPGASVEELEKGGLREGEYVLQGMREGDAVLREYRDSVKVLADKLQARRELIETVFRPGSVFVGLVSIIGVANANGKALLTILDYKEDDGGVLSTGKIEMFDNPDDHIIVTVKATVLLDGIACAGAINSRSNFQKEGLDIVTWFQDDSVVNAGLAEFKLTRETDTAGNQTASLEMRSDMRGYNIRNAAFKLKQETDGESFLQQHRDKQAALLQERQKLIEDSFREGTIYEGTIGYQTEHAPVQLIMEKSADDEKGVICKLERLDIPAAWLRLNLKAEACSAGIAVNGEKHSYYRDQNVEKSSTAWIYYFYDNKISYIKMNAKGLEIADNRSNGGNVVKVKRLSPEEAKAIRKKRADELQAKKNLINNSFNAEAIYEGTLSYQGNEVAVRLVAEKVENGGETATCRVERIDLPAAWAKIYFDATGKEIGAVATSRYNGAVERDGWIQNFFIHGDGRGGKISNIKLTADEVEMTNDGGQLLKLKKLPPGTAPTPPPAVTTTTAPAGYTQQLAPAAVPLTPLEEYNRKRAIKEEEWARRRTAAEQLLQKGNILGYGIQINTLKSEIGKWEKENPKPR